MSVMCTVCTHNHYMLCFSGCVTRKQMRLLSLEKFIQNTSCTVLTAGLLQSYVGWHSCKCSGKSDSEELIDAPLLWRWSKVSSGAELFPLSASTVSALEPHRVSRKIKENRFYTQGEFGIFLLKLIIYKNHKFSFCTPLWNVLSHSTTRGERRNNLIVCNDTKGEKLIPSTRCVCFGNWKVKQCFIKSISHSYAKIYNIALLIAAEIFWHTCASCFSCCSCRVCCWTASLR